MRQPVAVVARVGWMVAGWLLVAVGGIGVVVPGLPSTGFFILAAGCFSKSSPRFEQWILDLPGVGPLVADYRAGLGMPRSAKVRANVLMWVAIGISTGFVINVSAIRLAVIVLGCVGSWVILVRVPTKAPAG